MVVCDGQKSRVVELDAEPFQAPLVSSFFALQPLPVGGSLPISGRLLLTGGLALLGVAGGLLQNLFCQAAPVPVAVLQLLQLNPVV